jgi:hypothetical protein
VVPAELDKIATRSGPKTERAASNPLTASGCVWSS